MASLISAASKYCEPSLRLGGHLGVRYNIGSPQDDFEIYDVVSDPQEASNLAGRPGFDAVLHLSDERSSGTTEPRTSVERNFAG